MIVVAVLRKVLFPRSGRSLGIARKWLLAGTRLCTVAIGICLVLGSAWYIWIPVAGIAACLAADLPLAYRDRRSGKRHIIGS